MAGDGLPGSDPFEGKAWNGDRWVVVDPNSEPAPRGTIGESGQSVESRPTTQPMSRRNSGGLAMLAAVGIGLQGVAWIRGYDDLVARGNRLAGWIIVFGICALAIALVVGFWGVLRWSKRAQSLVSVALAPFAPIRKQVNDRRRRLRERPNGEPTADGQRHLEEQWWKTRGHGESGTDT